MAKFCKCCGGEVKPHNGGYQCIFCGEMYGSAEELEPPRSAKKSTRARMAEIPVTPKSEHGVDVFESNINAVLEITWSDSMYKHSGSGFLISEDGYAVTNAHVVTHETGRSCRQVNVRVCGETTVADVILLGDDRHGSGSGVDLALIKLHRVPVGARIVQFENFNNVRIGESVFVIGNSLGFGTCITGGIVSDKLRNVNGKMLMMTDCAVNGGNSGGPIFNERGLVIAAVVSGITAAEGMNFGIPSSTIGQFLQIACDRGLM